MCDISIIVPGIRPHYWERVYDSIKEACKKHSWELICGGPFKPPESLIGLNNFQYLHSYSTVPIVIQQLTLLANGVYVCHQVDDGILLPDSLDKCITQFENYCSIDILNMRYSEGVGFCGNVRSDKVWTVQYNPEFHLPFIDINWNTSVQPLMYKEFFISMGGFDCRFEYSNHCHHDFMFRAQSIGSKIIHSTCGVCCADHMPGESGDHKPIHNAQIHIDAPIFKEIWSNERKSKISYDNWKQYNKPWQRRFKSMYKSYQEMMEDKC